MTNNSHYYKKSAFAVRIVRYGVTVLLLLFVISCILLFKNDITIENIRLLAKYITLTDGSSDLYDNEFSVNSSLDSKTIMLRDNLAIISKSNISLYYLSGQKLFSYNYSYSSPAAVHDDHNILVYDVGGNELSLFNSFSKILSKKFSGRVNAADISENHFAVITDDDSYKSKLALYEFDMLQNDYVESFCYYSSSAHLMNVALSEGVDRILSSSAAAKDGTFYSKVMMYDTSSNSAEPLFTYEIEGELPLQIGFNNADAGAYVITDSALHFLDSSLKQTKTYRFNQSKVHKVFDNDNMIIFTENNNLSGNSVALRCFSTSGDEIFDISIEDRISDIAFGKECIFALGEKNVFKLQSDELSRYIIKDVYKLSSKYNSVVCDTNNGCYVIDNISTRKIDF